MESTLPNTTSVKKRRIDWVSIALLVTFLLFAGMALWMLASRVADGLAHSRFDAAQVAFEEETGIRVLRVAMTAGGGMVDLQYQVLDPDKSLIVHDDDSPPSLVDQATGKVIATPWHDHAFRELHTAVTYHELIMNGGGLMERGSKVTITVGDARLENIIVQ